MKKTKRLVQWFGSNTENAAAVGELLRGCKFVGIPFAGGMSEVPFIDAKQILCNDLHRGIINLCRVIRDDTARAALIQRADELPYHPDVLCEAQETAARLQENPSIPIPHFAYAFWYFISVWMGRGGKAGTTGEFDGALPIRWNANGGGSNRRYRTAIEALDAWGEMFRRCEFTCMDAFDFLAKLKDEQEVGVYVDAPWPDAGEEYLHRFGDDQQATLAGFLEAFQHARVVVRFGEHPLIRRLYPVADWDWLAGESRDQANAVKPEWLICRNVRHDGDRIRRIRIRTAR